MLELSDARRRAEAEAAAAEAAVVDRYLQILQASMGEEHVRMLEELFEQAERDGVEAVRNTPAFYLWEYCLEAIVSIEHRDWPMDDVPLEVVLAMPPVVAEALMVPGVQRYYQCTDCGYSLPPKVFSACPLCGGDVGHTAYERRRRRMLEPHGPQPDYRVRLRTES